MCSNSVNFRSDTSDAPPPECPKDADKQAPKSAVNLGVSVLGVKFDCGVMIAADNLVPYSSSECCQDVVRVFKMSENTIIGFDGLFDEYEGLKQRLDQKIMEYGYRGFDQPKPLHTLIARYLRDRLNRSERLLVNVIVGGMQDGAPFLGGVDKGAFAYEDNAVASGYGRFCGLPRMRRAIAGGAKLTQAQAFRLMDKCMDTVVCHRHTRAPFKYSVAVSTAEGSSVQGPF